MVPPQPYELAKIVTPVPFHESNQSLHRWKISKAARRQGIYNKEHKKIEVLMALLKETAKMRGLFHPEVLQCELEQEQDVVFSTCGNFFLVCTKDWIIVKGVNLQENASDHYHISMNT